MPFRTVHPLDILSIPMAALRVRVLCDGCECVVASVYCGKCKAASCKKCKSKYHATCHPYDLSNSSAVLALCVTCRQRPAHVRTRVVSCRDSDYFSFVRVTTNHPLVLGCAQRKSMNECIECRDNRRTRAHHHHHHHRSSNKVGSSRASRPRVGAQAAVRKTRRHSSSSGNDTSTEGDNGSFSRESSAE